MTNAIIRKSLPTIDKRIVKANIHVAQLHIILERSKMLSPFIQLFLYTLFYVDRLYQWFV